jgi:hypothetical protein
MDCQSALDYFQSIGKAPIAYCLDSTFRSICCRTCKSNDFKLRFIFKILYYLYIINYILEYDNLTCFDRIPDCPNLQVLCGTGANNVDDNCPKSCGTCESNIKIDFKLIRYFKL